jgi:PAS domain S-box-containing protein
MLLVDPESGMILNANDASARFYGYSKAELLAMRIDQINILSPEQVKTEREHAVSEERSYFVFPHKLANGEVRTVEVHSSPIVFQDHKILFSIIHDITKRKQAEHELQLVMEIAEVNTANITAILEGTANSIWAFNEQFEIVYINQVFRQEFYQTFGIWLDPGTSLINSLPEVIRPFWKKRYDRVLKNEQFTIEDAVDTENGIVYVQVMFNPIVKKGQVIGGSCFGSNITFRKLAEIELLNAKEHAQKSDRLKSAFLANMSHEIRTPMNGILGFSALLKEPDLTGEDQQKYIRIIEKSGARMLNIINDIVDISKIEAGLMEVNMKESNINDQIEYIFTFFKPETDGKGMRLSYRNSLPEKEAIIITDREKIYAILTNLVKNAIKYTDGGSIDFGYDVVKTQHETSLQFFVKDTGIGIAKNRQEAIFERFIQADIEDPKALQGAGLGLTIAKAYAEMLGGKIWVKSDEGIGSTFYFTIPYKTKKQGQSDIENVVAVEDIDVQIEKLKILIAEDDETSDFLITSMLKKNNHEVLHARTGIEVIEVCRTNPDLDLILMDIRMPNINGYEATRQIRQFNNEVIIIAQTSYGLTGDRQKAIDAGCNEYLSKPIKKDELLRLLQKHFQR